MQIYLESITMWNIKLSILLVCALFLKAGFCIGVTSAEEKDKRSVEKKVRYEGQRIRLRCQAPEADSKKVYWEMDGVINGFDKMRFKVKGQNNKILYGKELQVSDTGFYGCGADGGDTYSVTRLVVRKRMQFAPKPKNQVLEIGSKSKIRCKVNGPVNTIIKWYRFSYDRKKYKNLPQGVREHDGVLWFRSVQRGHAGYYACVAHSSAGALEAVISVDVLARPYFTTLPKNTSVEEGQTITLHCAANGNPAPKLQWDFNGHVVKDTSQHHLVEDGILVIKSAKESDSGVYGCTAGNRGGFTRTTAVVKVTSKKQHTCRVPTGLQGKWKYELEGIYGQVEIVSDGLIYDFFGDILNFKCTDRQNNTFVLQSTMGDMPVSLCFVITPVKQGFKVVRLSPAEIGPFQMGNEKPTITNTCTEDPSIDIPQILMPA